MAWIELHETIGTHKKTYALAEELGVPQYAAVGILSLLWTWALGAAQDGNLSAFPPHAIARACFWTKQPSSLMDALVKCGWLDGDMHIHDWYEYAGRLIEKREDTRKRVAAYRSRTKPACNAYSNADATRYVTSTKHVGNASTVPNRTVPYRTVNMDESIYPKPFLSDEDSRRLLDEQLAVEQEAKRCGLPTTDKGLSDAYDLLTVHGLDKLLDAVRKTGDQPKDKWHWRYVKAILDAQASKTTAAVFDEIDANGNILNTYTVGG